MADERGETYTVVRFGGDLGEILKQLKGSDPEFAGTFELLLAAFNLRKADAGERWRSIYQNLEVQFRNWGRRTRWAERRMENAITDRDDLQQYDQEQAFNKARSNLLLVGARLEAMRKLGEAFNNRFVGRSADLLDNKTGRQVLARNTDLGPTPETFIKPGRVPPVAGLYAAEHIDHAHLKAANEIAWVVETVTKLVGCRAKDLEANGGGLRDSSALPMLVSDIYSMRFKPWVNDQRNLSRTGQRHIELVFAVVVYGEGVLSARKRFHLGYERAVSYIRNSLTDYYKLMEGDDLARRRDQNEEVMA